MARPTHNGRTRPSWTVARSRLVPPKSPQGTERMKRRTEAGSDAGRPAATHAWWPWECSPPPGCRVEERHSSSPSVRSASTHPWRAPHRLGSTPHHTWPRQNRIPVPDRARSTPRRRTRGENAQQEIAKEGRGKRRDGSPT